MNDNKFVSLVIGIIGFICILLTIILFFLLVRNFEAMSWWALFFILLAEFITAFGLIFVYSTSRTSYKLVLYGGATALFLIYFVASIICSLLFSFLIRKGIFFLIALNLIFFALLIVSLILLMYFSNVSTLSSVQSTKDALAFWGALTAQSAVLKELGKASFEKPLGQLYEAIRFSDHSTVLDGDYDIEEELNQLKHLLEEQDEGKEEAILDRIQRVISIVEIRKQKVRELKRGSI